MEPPPAERLEDLQDQLARRAAAAALDPAADPKVLPQLVAVAARALAIASKGRRGPSPSPTSRDPATEDHPELPPIPEVLPGPPWDPFRDASPEQQEAWNDELIARRSVWLREQADELEQALDRPDLLAKVHADLRAVRAGPSPSPALRVADATEDGEL